MNEIKSIFKENKEISSFLIKTNRFQSNELLYKLIEKHQNDILHFTFTHETNKTPLSVDIKPQEISDLIKNSSKKAVILPISYLFLFNEMREINDFFMEILPLSKVFYFTFQSDFIWKRSSVNPLIYAAGLVSCIVELIEQELRVIVKKRGKVEHLKCMFKANAFYEPVKQQKTTEKVLPTSSFDLNLNAREREQKENLILPYVEKQKIEYEDTVEEELSSDPDDDLDF